MPKKGKISRKKSPNVALIGADSIETIDSVQPICSPHMRLIEANKILSGTYNPQKFKFRENKIEQIQKAIKSLSIKQKPKKSRIIMITGSPGTGKTLCANYILRTSPYRTIFMNANTIKSKTDVQQILLKQILHKDFQNEDFNTFKIINELVDAKIQPVIIYIEEIELFFKSSTEMLSEDFFDLFNRKNLRLILLGISNTIDAVEKHGEKMKVRVNDITNIVFQPYSNEQISQIMSDKLEFLYAKTGIRITFPGNLIKYTVNKICQLKQSDMRFVFQFLKSLGKVLLPQDRQNFDEIVVSIDHINLSLNQVKTNKLMITETIPFGQQMVVIAIYNHLSRYDSLFLSEQQLVSSLREVFEIMNVGSLKQLKQQLSQLEDYGFVEMKSKKNSNKKDRIFLKMSLDEVKMIYQDHPKYGKLLLY